MHCLPALPCCELLGGMPVVTLSDVARLRLDSISFFLLLIVLATFAVRWCWNALAADFSNLPRLTVGKSFAVVTLWGLVFLLALTMISGARELMTPGAWEKDGLTYELSEADHRGENVTLARHEQDLEARRMRLANLYELLVFYAQEHEQSFPTDLSVAVAAESLRHPPDWPDAPYEYFGPRDLDSTGERLVAEPNVYVGRRLVLLVGGAIIEEQ